MDLIQTGFGVVQQIHNARENVRVSHVVLAVAIRRKKFFHAATCGFALLGLWLVPAHLFLRLLFLLLTASKVLALIDEVFIPVTVIVIDEAILKNVLLLLLKSFEQVFRCAVLRPYLE